MITAIAAIATILQTAALLAVVANAPASLWSEPAAWMLLLILVPIVPVVLISLWLNHDARKERALQSRRDRAEWERVEAARKLARNREPLISHRVNRTRVSLRA